MALSRHSMLLACLLGAAAGIGGYTFRYAEGLSYMSNDPRACTPSSGLRDHGVCRFGPRVRLPDDPMDRSYAAALTSNRGMKCDVVIGLSAQELAGLTSRLGAGNRKCTASWPT